MPGPMATDSITKSLSDKRQYRKVVLKNSLEVLLISDSETDKCAASMEVGVGSFSDPVGLEGLAHFLEHMLFYASEKYPLEDSYSKYISEHGGSTNAFTASRHTNYYFDVNTDSFEEALDRFAQFFIKPLMSPDATTREIKAVDSENQKNLLSDAWKMHQLQKHLSDVNHPYHKFSTGNWETLEVRPKEKGIDTRSKLIEFYKQNYSANIMHLVIYSKAPLDEIQLLVEEKFQYILNYNKNMCSFPGQPCNQDHLQLLIKAIPIQEGHTLRVEWPITPNILHYKEAPCRYLGHLIGHEGEGSLFHVLKTMGWATSLSAGEGDWTKDYSFFTVTIDLTESGHVHMQQVVGLLLRYIELVKQSGVCKWIFDELASVSDTSFHYQDKGRPIDYVVQISTNMQLYPVQDWLVGSSLPSKFSPTVIQTVLDQLSLDNIRIFWHSKKFEGTTDLIEPWYGTPYITEKLTNSIIQEWVSSAPNANLHLPLPNMFIPTNLSLINFNARQIHLPVLLRNSPLSSLWYKPDSMFSMPKAYVILDFTCPTAYISPEAGVLTDIFVRMLMDYINEYAYYAKVAELSCSVAISDRGFEVTVAGYNHKLRSLLEKIVKEIAQFSVKEDRFHVMKEMAKKDLENFKFQQPYQQAMYYCSLILDDQSYHWTEAYEALLRLQPEDLTRFSSTLLSRVFLECYIGGNIEQAEALSIVENTENTLFKGPSPVSHPLFPSQHFTKRILNLPKGSHHFYQDQVLNPNDENSSLLHYIQVGPDDFLMNVKLQLFTLFAKQPAFHQLRSVEQLGYITVLMQRNDSGVRGAQFIIQSTAKGPAGIDQRVHEFLKSLEEKLVRLSPDEFQKNVETLIEMKLEKHKNLREESEFYWGEVSNGTLKFDRVEREVAALRQISHKDLMEFFEESIKVGSAGKKCLSVRMYGSLHMAEYKSDKCEDKKLHPNSTQIEDIFCFRRSQQLYGSLVGRRVQGKL